MAVSGQSDFGARLVKALGCPANTYKIVLTCAVGEVVAVECHYRPDPDIDAIEQLFVTYEPIIHEPSGSWAATGHGQSQVRQGAGR
jgi:hypothetical protein